MKIIGVTGGTGLVGQHLTTLLTGNGYDVVIFTRTVAGKKPQPHVTYAYWDPVKGAFDINPLKRLDAIVHLAGEGIADKRWTQKRKNEIVNSRVAGTKFLVAQLKAHAPHCKTMISASATGFYGYDRPGSSAFTEDCEPANDFLGSTCRQWEEASHEASEFIRTVILRFGIVLGREGGVFAEFARPMSLGIMPILGSGRQVVSWIAVDDLAGLIVHALQHKELHGVYNAVTGQPVTHRQLMKTMAKVKGGIKIPIPVPAFGLRLLLGEMSEAVLGSCTVSAGKTMGIGFTFTYPEIEGAVRALSAPLPAPPHRQAQ